MLHSISIYKPLTLFP